MVERGSTHAALGGRVRVCPFISRFFLGSQGKEVMHVIMNGTVCLLAASVSMRR